MRRKKPIKIPQKPKPTGPKKIQRGSFLVQDEWFDKAKQHGYRARSAFKLIQVDEKFRLIKPHMMVLDVASAPGSWLQVLSQKLTNGFVIGFDLQAIKPLKKPNVATFVGDIFEHEEVENQIKSIIETKAQTNWKGKFDLITSDIAPKTTGQKDVDQYASIELNLAILDLAKKFLRPGGTLVMKVFLGEDINDLIAPVKKNFSKLQRFSPPAVRQRSFEEYFVCIGKKN